VGNFKTAAKSARALLRSLRRSSKSPPLGQRGSKIRLQCDSFAQVRRGPINVVFLQIPACSIEIRHREPMVILQILNGGRGLPLFVSATAHHRREHADSWSLPACVTAVEAAGAVSKLRTCWVPAAGADVGAASAGERSACETRRAMPPAAFRRRGSDSDSGAISAKLNRMPPRLRSRPLAGFIEPCLPRPVDRPPIGGTGCTK
jgi:hypothetical protein